MARCFSDNYRYDPKCRNWPAGRCELPQGHLQDHQFRIEPGDVFFQWPQSDRIGRNVWFSPTRLDAAIKANEALNDLQEWVMLENQYMKMDDVRANLNLIGLFMTDILESMQIAFEKALAGERDSRHNSQED